MDLYTGLATGSTIVSADRALTEDLGELMEYLKEQQPAYWVSTPSFADLCLGALIFPEKHFPHCESSSSAENHFRSILLRGC